MDDNELTPGWVAEERAKRFVPWLLESLANETLGNSIIKTAAAKALQSLSLESVRSEALEQCFRALNEFDDDVDMKNYDSVAQWWQNHGGPALNILRSIIGPDSPARVAEDGQDSRRKGKYRLVYNKATRKIDKVSNLNGLVAESFDPPLECEAAPEVPAKEQPK